MLLLNVKQSKLDGQASGKAPSARLAAEQEKEMFLTQAEEIMTLFFRKHAGNVMAKDTYPFVSFCRKDPNRCYSLIFGFLRTELSDKYGRSDVQQNHQCRNNTMKTKQITMKAIHAFTILLTGLMAFTALGEESKTSKADKVPVVIACRARGDLDLFALSPSIDLNDTAKTECVILEVPTSSR